ncbi:hypothetical protein NP233_g7873 [Leucocoprinus birnbaumii]|uniref:Uncharacterized protein n=1 Tax=Leucocoprinus birnbaumii TaxID=56174 RepID=A0AAD5VTV6_9AGAR|nr:hypothetical protein NP233_g7873 [Leucocoprinus birnbaumii]
MPPVPNNTVSSSPPSPHHIQDDTKPDTEPVKESPYNDTVFPPVSNPWKDDDNVPESNVNETSNGRELKTPDPSLFDQVITASIVDNSRSSTEEEQKPPPVSKDVLSEFDPLAVSAEEQAAHDAWESAESHPPPPPRTPSPLAPLPPAKDDQLLSAPTTGTDSLFQSAANSPTPLPISPTSSSSFPSLAALARTFAIPSFSPQVKTFVDQRPSGAENGRSPGASGANTPARRSGASSPAIRESPSSDGNGSKPAEGQFDFQKFLDQMKTRQAEPVSKYLRSFLSNFSKRTFTVSDQIKIINDFLNFISGQMRNCDIWKNASDAEFDNAMEGMEKLVMNRLYDFTFTPQVVRAHPSRPITTDDLERDRVLSQRIALFGWLEEKHLDIPEEEGSKGFLMFAQQELIKINHYKAPRDKLICILNCCKVIFGLLRHLKKEEGADSFLPILIFVVLKANPDHLLSNVEFISRFRNPTKLQSEAGYYLSSLMGAVSFIETMDHTSLSCITQEEFEKNVEQAIQNLPASEPESPDLPKGEASLRAPPSITGQSPHAGEESAQPLSINTPVQVLSEDAKRLLQKTGDTISKPLNAIGRIFSEALDGAENKLSYLPGPFAPFELGREQRDHMIGPDGQPLRQHQRLASGAGPPQTPINSGLDPVQTPYKPRIRRGPSPSLHATGTPPGTSPVYGSGYAGPDDTPSRPTQGPQTNQSLAIGPSQVYPGQHAPSQSLSYSPNNQTLLPPRVQSLASGNALFGGEISRTPTPNLDFAGVQAEIDTAHEQAAKAARDTLRQIFPTVDREIVDWVLEAKEGDLGKSIEALLEMSSALNLASASVIIDSAMVVRKIGIPEYLLSIAFLTGSLYMFRLNTHASGKARESNGEYSDKLCSKRTLGWTIGGDVANFLNAPDIENIALSKTVMSLLVFHPLATGLSFVAFIMGCCVYRCRRTCRDGLPSNPLYFKLLQCFVWVAFVSSSAAFMINVIIVSMSQTRLSSSGILGVELRWGNAIIAGVIAWLCLFLGAIYANKVQNPSLHEEDQVRLAASNPATTRHGPAHQVTPITIPESHRLEVAPTYKASQEDQLLEAGLSEPPPAYVVDVPSSGPSASEYRDPPVAPGTLGHYQ